MHTDHIQSNSDSEIQTFMLKRKDLAVTSKVCDTLLKKKERLVEAECSLLKTVCCFLINILSMNSQKRHAQKLYHG